MTRFVAALAAFALVFCLAGEASAAPTPRAKELARRYIVALDMKKTVGPMMDSMMAGLADQELDELDLAPEQRALVVKAIRDAFSQSMASGLIDEMMAELEPLLAETFSEEELQAMVDFYESPVGRSMMAKMPAFGERSSALMVKFAPRIQADVERRVEENILALNLRGN